MLNWIEDLVMYTTFYDRNYKSWYSYLDFFDFIGIKNTTVIVKEQLLS